MVCKRCEHFKKAARKMYWKDDHTIFICKKLNTVRFVDWDEKTCPYFSEYVLLTSILDDNIHQDACGKMSLTKELKVVFKPLSKSI